MQHPNQVKWSNEAPTEKQYNGQSVVVRKLTWYDEGDDQNPTPFANVAVSHYIGKFVNNDIHIGILEVGDYSMMTIITNETTPPTINATITAEIDYYYDRLELHNFVSNDGGTNTQWQWALL